MQVRMMGRNWRLRYAPNLANDGDCQPPTVKDKEIRLSSELDKASPDHLETVVHELTHAAFYWMREYAVSEFAADLTRVLWRMGYRKCE